MIFFRQEARLGGVRHDDAPQQRVDGGAVLAGEEVRALQDDARAAHVLRQPLPVLWRRHDVMPPVDDLQGFKGSRLDHNKGY